MKLDNIKLLQPIKLEFDSIKIVNDDPVCIYLIKDGVPVMVQEEHLGKSGIRLGDTITLTKLSASISFNNVKL